MANIALKKENVPAPAQAPTFDAFKVMRDMLAWDPFREMRPLFPTINAAELSFAPAFEVKETPTEFVFKADLPGVKESDLDVSLTGDRLTISGKRETEGSDKTDTYYTWERSYGAFTRTFTLPGGVDADHAKADLKEGVLTLVLPKTPEAQARKISIKAGDKAKA